MLFVTTRNRPLKKKDGLRFKNILFPVFAQNVNKNVKGCSELDKETSVYINCGENFDWPKTC